MSPQKMAAVTAGLFFSTLIQGQAFRGGIAGTVMDQTGATVAGATVKLRNTDTGLTRTAQSTRAGEFGFQDLPLGKYSLTVSQQGFQTQAIRDINVEAGKIFNLQAKLSVATQATTVEVAASTVAIMSSRISFQGTLL